LTTLAGSLSLVALSASADDANGQWSITAEGMYAKQNSVLPSYGRTSNTGEFLDFPSDNEWGYGVAIGYAMPNSQHDVVLSYDNLSTDDSTTHPETSNYSFPGFSAANGQVYAKSKLDYQAVDLLIGTTCNFSDNLDGRLGYGVSYVDIDQHGTVTPSAGTAGSFAKNKSTFQGFGPKVTGDLSYKFVDNFSFVAGVGGSMLFGEAKTHTTAKGTPGVVDVNDSNEKVAFALESKAGFRYDFAFNQQSAMNIEIGYKGTNVLNAMDDVNAGYTFAAGNNSAGYSYDDNYYNYGGYVSLGVDFM